MRQKILSFYLITVPPECGTFMCLLNNYWKQLSKAMPNFLKSFQPPNITFSTATRSDLYKVLIRLYTFLCVLNPCFFSIVPKTQPTFSGAEWSYYCNLMSHNFLCLLCPSYSGVLLVLKHGSLSLYTLSLLPRTLSFYSSLLIILLSFHHYFSACIVPSSLWISPSNTYFTISHSFTLYFLPTTISCYFIYLLVIN